MFGISLENETEIKVMEDKYVARLTGIIWIPKGNNKWLIEERKKRRVITTLKTDDKALHCVREPAHRVAAKGYVL